MPPVPCAFRCGGPSPYVLFILLCLSTREHVSALAIAPPLSSGSGWRRPCPRPAQSPSPARAASRTSSASYPRSPRSPGRARSARGCRRRPRLRKGERVTRLICFESARGRGARSRPSGRGASSGTGSKARAARTAERRHHLTHAHRDAGHVDRAPRRRRQPAHRAAAGAGRGFGEGLGRPAGEEGPASPPPMHQRGAAEAGRPGGRWLGARGGAEASSSAGVRAGRGRGASRGSRSPASRATASLPPAPCGGLIVCRPGAALLQWGSRRGSAYGHTAGWPASGSRRIELAKPLAALFGLPGRIETVGSRSVRPSMKPLRL